MAGRKDRLPVKTIPDAQPQITALKQTISGLQGHLQELVSNLDLSTIKIESANDAYKLATSVAALSRAFAEIARLEDDKKKIVEQAQNEYYAAMRELLSGRPDIVEVIVTMMEQAKERVLLPGGSEG
ncbi:MAG: hypothetical protein ACOYXY_01025 [Thermodesulfobacteriota bacterium]